MEELAQQQLASAIEELISRGWGLPIHFAIVSRSGDAICGRYVKDGARLNAVFTARHLEGKTMLTPLNLMLISSDGQEAERIFIGDDGTARHSWN